MQGESGAERKGISREIRTTYGVGPGLPLSCGPYHRDDSCLHLTTLGFVLQGQVCGGILNCPRMLVFLR